MRTPPTPVRLDGYIRVSRVGKRRSPRFISPTIQREAIEGWAARQNAQLMEVFEEFDESGKSGHRRPLLELAIERIEQGATAGLVVWRVDRFGRSLNDGVQIIERIRSVDGRFYSVHDGLDISTEAGRLALRILLSVAEFHLEGLQASWDAARRHAIRRGAYVQSSIPVGYRKRRSGRLRPDPKTGPIMTELYRRRAAGDGLAKLCTFLEEQGVRTGMGNPGWSPRTLGYVMRGRVYLGEVHSGRYSNSHAHPPLIDAATWQAAQHPPNVRKHPKHPALLVGLTRCAGCGHMMSPDAHRKRGRAPVPAYKCHRYHARGRCPAPCTIVASKLESYVLETMFNILSRRRREPEAQLVAAEAKAEAAAKALDRYRDNDRIAAVIGDRAFLDGLATRQERLQDARLDVVDARTRARLHRVPPVADLRRELPNMSIDEKRAIVAKVIDVVFVVSTNSHAVEQRVMVCPAGTAPRGLPHQGDRGRPIRTIKPRRGWINPKPRAQRSGGELRPGPPRGSVPATNSTQKAHARAG